MLAWYKANFANVNSFHVMLYCPPLSQLHGIEESLRLHQPEAPCTCPEAVKTVHQKFSVVHDTRAEEVKALLIATEAFRGECMCEKMMNYLVLYYLRHTFGLSKYFVFGWGFVYKTRDLCIHIMQVGYYYYMNIQTSWLMVHSTISMHSLQSSQVARWNV